jgi:hypothetical protein
MPWAKPVTPAAASSIASKKRLEFDFMIVSFTSRLKLHVWLQVIAKFALSV